MTSKSRTPEPGISDEAYASDAVALDEAHATESTEVTSIVYKGLPPYGTEFLTSHHLTRQNLEDILRQQGVEEDEAKAAVKEMGELTFHKDNDFRVSAEGVHADVIALLDKDPAFKVEKG